MPICFDEARRVFRLDTANTSYALAAGPYDYLMHLYYGVRIPDTDLTHLFYQPPHASASSPRVSMEKPSFSPNLATLEYSGNGCSDMRGTALSIRTANGTTATDVRYLSHKIYAGKPTIPGQPATFATEDEADTLEILCHDPASGMQITLFYTAFRNHDVITRHVAVKNTTAATVTLERVMSACVDFRDAKGMDFVHLYGDWARVRLVERAPLLHGTQLSESRRGTSSHTHNPFIALCAGNATEESGDAFGFNLVYSGNFVASVEADVDETARVMLGIHPNDFRWLLAPGEVFYSPEVVMVYSDAGLGKMSRTYHSLYRHHLCRGKWTTERRPILINNWEATYFTFDEEKLYNIAKTASELGIEMFVMDDGWFGARNSAEAGLGDWVVNEEKLKGGLGALTRRIHALGMKFGIWFEPEMVNPDSDLFRAHPEWTLHVEGRERSVSRYQYVLDMSRADVRDYLFNCIKNVMDSAEIDYIKWDFNRPLTEVASALLDAAHQGEVYHRYVLGLYDLLDRVTSAYPDLLLEGCASGGGRFDPAMLYYSPQIWTSDCSDAIERLDIQYGTSLCYPISAMGAHVSASPNHQLLRSSPLRTRGDVALAGTFGYELDLGTLTEEEREEVREQCRRYHRYYDVIHYGDYYRLLSPFDGRKRAAWCFVSEDQSEALLTYVLIRGARGEHHIVRLAGLDPKRMYREEESGQVLSGAAWMNLGLCIPERLNDKTSRTYYFKAVD